MSPQSKSRRARGLIGCVSLLGLSACGAELAPASGEQSDSSHAGAPRTHAMGAPPAEEPANVADQVRLVAEEKQSWTPEQRKVSSQLLFAVKEQRGEAFPKVGPSPLVTLGVVGGLVVVDIRAEVSDELLETIRSLGGGIVSSVPRFDAIQARMPIDEIEELAADSRVLGIEPAWGAVTNVISNGDIAHRANTVRLATGYDGTGIKVGVLSDAVDSLAGLQASGELPLVTVLPGQAGSGGSEGTAMLEIVHDLAPGAELYFATAFGSEANFAANILALRAAGCDIIVDDVFYFAEGVFQDDIIAQAVQSVIDDGALYFSSAGNSANLFSEPGDNGTPTFDAGVYEGDFQPGPIPAAVQTFDPSAIDAHVFASGSVYQTITQDGPSYYTLEWSDPLGGSDNDYDLYLLNPAKTALAGMSIGTQDGNQDPFEAIPTAANHTSYHLVVARYGGAPNGTPDARFIRVNAHRGRFAVGSNGQISGHSAVPAAFSVAAVGGPWALGIPTPPVVFGAATSVEAFTSDGPRRVFYTPSGTPLGDGFLSADASVRLKPDIAAADGVATATPGFNPFFGTSASAPHAAALAALVMQANPYMQTIGTAEASAAMRAAFARETIDIHTPGFDDVSGTGIIMADSAQPFDYCTGLELSATPRSPQPEGTQITIEATSIGCSAPQYRFRWRAKGGAWVPLGGFTAANSSVFSTEGLAPGRYTLEVAVRQAGTTTAQSVTTIPFTLQDLCDSVTLEVSPTGAQPIGTELVATALATGCAMPQYRFDYRALGSATWSSFGGYADTANVSLDTTLLSAGDYQFRVRVKGKGTAGFQDTEIVGFSLTE
jgi:hypothetical protein